MVCHRSHRGVAPMHIFDDDFGFWDNGDSFVVDGVPLLLMSLIEILLMVMLIVSVLVCNVLVGIVLRAWFMIPRSLRCAGTAHLSILNDFAWLGVAIIVISVGLGSAAQEEGALGVLAVGTGDGTDGVAGDADALVLIVGRPDAAKAHDEEPSCGCGYFAGSDGDEQRHGIDGCRNLIECHEEVVEEGCGWAWGIARPRQVVQDHAEDIRNEG
mmetsp:Transcript_9505/g.25823  ORF Transcript_9505/g.25823 Transcript_9505/m.25823 type:complete len:213 (-) Transcript_9505:776-1414(-)